MNEQIDSGLLDARHLVNRFESSDGVVTKANVARRYGDEDCLQN